MGAPFLRSVLGRALFDQRRSIGWWAVGIAGFVVLMVLYWPSIRDQGEDLQRVVDSMPAAMKAFSGDLSAFTSAPGYLQAELFGLALPMLLVVYGIGRGSDAIAGEEERGHLEMTLAEPVSRVRVALEKAGALGLGLIALGLAAFIAVAAGAAALSMELSATRLLIAVTGTVVFGFAMGALALAVGGLTGRKAIATGVPAGVVVVAWLLEGDRTAHHVGGVGAAAVALPSIHHRRAVDRPRRAVASAPAAGGRSRSRRSRRLGPRAARCRSVKGPGGSRRAAPRAGEPRPPACS